MFTTKKKKKNSDSFSHNNKLCDKKGFKSAVKFLVSQFMSNQ